ncbi:hypothetical protein HaLaN_11999 [Haematococcus lacustris]|uniref:Uncharacterized protein n=1 Tax=Haematococcus lacustris TaxID=44745 RepID=A0A699Z9C5_HAELA|nr:hypothetical protein HaLaN_11999 [Haematococcus lacustris]
MGGGTTHQLCCQAQRNIQANGAAHWANNHNYTWHAKKCKMHTLMRGVSAAGLEAGAVVPSEVVEARLYAQLVLWVEACSRRALLASLLLALMRYREYVAMTLVTWPAMWAELSKPRWSNARFRLYRGKQRTVANRVSSARTNVVAGHAEGFSMATRSRIRGLICSTSTGIRFYDRDVSAALNIRQACCGSGSGGISGNDSDMCIMARAK